MLYVTTDIHGEYDLFQKLLGKIKFSDSDSMIICGDMVDKGPNSVQLAKFVFNSPNIRCVMGNHEFAFLKYCEALMGRTSKRFDGALEMLQNYFQGDGELLDWETIESFKRMPLFIETDEYICVHAGVPLDEKGYCLPLQYVATEQLVYDRSFKEPYVLPKTEKCILFGHTPTNCVSGENKILKYPRIDNPQKITDYYKIHLDMGTMSSGIIGCICKETFEEFYVEKE